MSHRGATCTLCRSSGGCFFFSYFCLIYHCEYYWVKWPKFVLLPLLPLLRSRYYRHLDHKATGGAKQRDGPDGAKWKKKKGTSVVEKEVLVFCVESALLWLTWVYFQVGKDRQCSGLAVSQQQKIIIVGKYGSILCLSDIMVYVICVNDMLKRNIKLAWMIVVVSLRSTVSFQTQYFKKYSHRWFHLISFHLFLWN